MGHSPLCQVAADMLDFHAPDLGTKKSCHGKALATGEASPVLSGTRRNKNPDVNEFEPIAKQVY